MYIVLFTVNEQMCYHNHCRRIYPIKLPMKQRGSGTTYTCRCGTNGLTENGGPENGAPLPGSASHFTFIQYLLPASFVTAGLKINKLKIKETKMKRDNK